VIAVVALVMAIVSGATVVDLDNIHLDAIRADARVDQGLPP
jgi:hypothetical protein